MGVPAAKLPAIEPQLKLLEPRKSHQIRKANLPNERLSKTSPAKPLDISSKSIIFRHEE